MKDIGNNKKIARNTLYMYARMAFAIVISLYTSRVVLNVLGVVDFGIFSVVGGFIALLNFLTTSLSSSIQRYYNYEEQKKGKEGFVQIYKISLLIYIAASLFLLVFFETFGLWYVNNIMNIPPERLHAGNIVFQVAIISVICSMMQTPYSGAIIAKEYLNFYAFTGILDVILRLGGVIFLSYIAFDKLIVYAFISLSVTILNFILYYLYAKRKILNTTIRIKIDTKLIKPILSFSIFNIIGTFSMMLKSQGISLLLNYFFGPIINAARSIAYQVNTAISGFCYNLAIAVRPQLINAYASGNYDRTRMLLFNESKLCFVLIATIITPVIIEIQYVLHFWLGEAVPNYTSTFVVLILIDMLINTLNVPISQIAQATGSVKKYQLANTIVNLGLLPLSAVLLTMRYSPNSVYVLMIVFSCTNQMVCTFIANKLFTFGIRDYLRKVIGPCLTLAILLPILPFVLSHLLSPSFLRLSMVSVTSVLVSFALTYTIIMNRMERKFIKEFLRKKIKK